MQGELTAYFDRIIADYKAFWPDWQTDKNKKEMVEDFIASLRFEVGNKYIKVVKRDSVHSFIVRNDTGKFKAGDILKAASWKTPATNFVRGNLFEKTFDRVRWTGVI
jgi:hypothetical protein